MEKVYENLKQGVNPYLPSWEYIPDGEPYVFNDRVYVYGSHDKFNGDVYCMLDYVCYSAPVDNLADWRYEGVIFRKDQDPANGDLQGNLYAPAVTVGPDGRYYLYYVLSSWGCVSVAVCDEPAGQYEFYGYVHYADGTRLGEKEGDTPTFDPAVLTEGDVTYLYTGFSAVGDETRLGAFGTKLDKDMLTVLEGPVVVAPGEVYSHNKMPEFGTDFEGHAFFEGPSIRKKDGLYYFIYSSQLYHELCYAVSDKPLSGFKYKGCLVSNGDLNIDSYKRADEPAYYCANNHGSMVKIKDDYYIFYHRHTNGTNYSRQECFEKLTVDENGDFIQAEITSNHGMNPLKGEGEYPTYIACNLFTDVEVTYVPWSGWMDDRFPKITQEGGDGDEYYGYVANMRNSATAGFKYFDCKGIKKVAINSKGYATGVVEVRTKKDGDVLGTIPVGYANVLKRTEGEVNIPDGVNTLYFTFRGDGHLQFMSFELIK